MLKTVLIITILDIKQYEKDTKIYTSFNFGNGHVFTLVRVYI